MMQTLTAPEIHNPNNIIAFRGEKHPLSTLFPVEGGISYDAVNYPSVEHSYKTQVTYYSCDDLKMYITKTDSPIQMMKHINSELELDTCEESLTARIGIIKALLQSKLERLEVFHRFLTTSGDNVLVEATNNHYLASGLPRISATINIPSERWPGQNKLHQLLMEVRKDAMKKERKVTKVIEANTAKSMLLVSHDNENQHETTPAEVEFHNQQSLSDPQEHVITAVLGD